MDRLLAEPGSLTHLLDGGEGWRSPVLGWLGQAGFLVRLDSLVLAIDPYLSDSLAVKYRGTRFPHVRLMPPPIEPARLVGLHAVLCTHAHTDHMDPETLSKIAKVSPQCRFVVPRAEQRTALERGVPAKRLVAMDAGEQVALSGNLAVRALPSAHERLETDSEGHHRFLGYVLHVGDAAIYHAGDCVPYDGLAEHLAGCRGIDLALLPINGRDTLRRDQGVPGNFTWEEAVELCMRCGIPAMMACHFGMFDFNTVAESWLDEQIAGLPPTVQCVRPRVGYLYRLAPSAAAPDAAREVERTMP